MAAALAAGALLCAWPQPASGRVTLAIVPRTTLLQHLADAGLSVGLLSSGIGNVSAEQTYRDISAGNREPPPSDAVPGLLRTTLTRAGISGSLRELQVGPDDVSRLVAGLNGADLLIVLGKPPPGENGALPIGIAGTGFHGTLTSDSTRTRGYVLSTDLAPTVLGRLGIPIPDEMDGEPIRAEGAVDPGAVSERGERMTAVAQRRVPVLVGCLAAWIAAAVAVGLASRARRRAAAAWLGLSFAYLPLLLLSGAALEPEFAAVEGLLVAVGAAGLAMLTLALARGWWAAAIACAVTVGAYAIDMLSGSQLTKLSLLGPNPIYGARFFGIGNELEALFAVMVPVGVGAALTAAGRPAGRRAAATFLIAGGVAALVFAAGRFGADVGAAIVLPLGAAVAAAIVTGSGETPRQRLAWAVLAAPLIALAVLALIDLISGGDSHLTRSVFDAGGAGDLADVAERRLRLSAHDFAQAARNPLFWLIVAGVGVAAARWRRIDAFLRPAPLVRAGVIGACAAVTAGVLVNDSGATFLVLGTLALGATLAFAWGRAPGTNP